MYVDGLDRGRALVDAYALAVGARSVDLTTAVPVLLALRQVVQADHFARRLAGGDLTGIAGREEKLYGLHAAERLSTAVH